MNATGACPPPFPKRDWKKHFLTNSYALFLLIFMFEGMILCVMYPWLLLAGPLLLIVGAIVMTSFGESIRMKRQGWVVSLGEYKEMINGKPETIRLECIDQGCGRYHLQLPTEQDWRKIAPDWAAGRREEIFARMARQTGADSIGYPEDWKLGDLPADPFTTLTAASVKAVIAIAILVFFVYKAGHALGAWN